VRDRDRIAEAPADRIAEALGCGIGAGLVERLMAEPRLRLRLVDIAAGHLGPTGALNQAQAAILGMARGALDALALRVGAAWHARLVARIIDAPTRRMLAARWGDDVIAFALHGLPFAPPDEPVDLAPETMVALAPAEGAACLAAWCAVQPPPVASRIALLRPAAACEPKHRSWGPAIVDWAAGRP
jgi:hypothetical protein